MSRTSGSTRLDKGLLSFTARIPLKFTTRRPELCDVYEGAPGFPTEMCTAVTCVCLRAEHSRSAWYFLHFDDDKTTLYFIFPSSLLIPLLYFSAYSRILSEERLVMLRQLEGRRLNVSILSPLASRPSAHQGLLRRALLPTARAYMSIERLVPLHAGIHARGYATPPGGGAGGPGGFNMFGQKHQKGEALKEYSVDLTELARNGKLDPTIGRDEEIRRTIQSAWYSRTVCHPVRTYFAQFFLVARNPTPFSLAHPAWVRLPSSKDSQVE